MDNGEKIETNMGIITGENGGIKMDVWHISTSIPAEVGRFSDCPGVGWYALCTIKAFSPSYG